MSFVDMTGWRMSQHGVEGSRVTVIKREGTASDGHAQWLCRCDCGKEFLASSTNLRQGHVRSCGCLQLQSSKMNKYRLAGRHHDNLVVNMTGWHMWEHGVPDSIVTVLYKTDKRLRGEVVWHCIDKNGFEGDYPGSRLRNGVTCSCGSLSSKGEQKIQNLLILNGIPYEKQKRFEDCRFLESNYYAHFDFYVNNQYIIEYDGEQHFKQTTWGTHDYVVKHDAFKNQYCKDHNIPIIRIPYTHYEDLCIEDLKLETSTFKIY